MNYSEYDALPGIRWSDLKLAATSPFHFHSHVQKESRALDLGRLTHVSVFQPEELMRSYTVYRKTRNGKDWTAFKEQAEAAGQEVAYPADWDKACAIGEAVHRHPVARGYLRKGFAEETVQWTDEATGLPCKARLDFISTDTQTVLDLKTARDISPRAFARATHDLMYFGQAAHYLAGLKAVTNEDWRWVFIAVENTAPFDVRVGPLTDDALYAGEQERRRLLELVAACEASGSWPGAYETESEFDLPSWYYAEGEMLMEATL